MFGEFWLENELAIMFADTGVGKSILAVQIAESVACGTSIGPLLNTAGPQTVLYLDFELTDRQFEMRYAAEADDADEKHLTGHYRFSDNFYRVEIDVAAALPDGFASFDQYLHAAVERLIRQTGARVLIVDNLTFLKRSNESTREALPLMNELNRLKKLYGLSILVLAHTPKRSWRRGITINDLQGSKILSNFADSIFAIGRVRAKTDGRYIKHIKSRSGELIYHAEHVPCFRINRGPDDNFLNFGYRSFEPEVYILADEPEEEMWAVIERIKQMHDSGMTIRAIAAQLEMSKTVVHRRLQMWEPSKDSDENAESGQNHMRERVGSSIAECGMQNAESDQLPTSIGQLAETGQNHLCERVDSSSSGLGQHHANPTAESFDAAAYLNGHRDFDDEPGEEDGSRKKEVRSQKPEVSTTPEQQKTQPKTTNPKPKTSNRKPATNRLRRSTDAYGRTIWIEKQTPDGKPLIWYKTDNKGNRHRHTRRLTGITIELVQTSQNHLRKRVGSSLG